MNPNRANRELKMTAGHGNPFFDAFKKILGAFPDAANP
jgi:hypothetical protein